MADDVGTHSLDVQQECTFMRGRDSRVNGVGWEELENELFEEQIFQSEESGSGHFATPFKYVTSVGRGCRKMPDPNDIRLPRAYYHNLKQNQLPDDTVNFKHPAGRGRVLRNHSSHNIDQNHQPQNSFPLEKNFLGATTRGLTSEIMEGKACLMEKFLGEPLGQNPMNPFKTRHHFPDSLRSTQTAPVLNLIGMDQWPELGQGCQSDCGQTAGRRLGAEGQAYPTKNLSLNDIIKTISSSSNWEKSSVCSSKKDNSIEGRNSGGKKLRKMKKRQGDASHHDKGTVDMGEMGVMPPSWSEPVSEERVSGDGVNNASRSDQGAIPTGDNLIQLESLPEDITEQHLRDVMSCFGPVVDCIILKDSETQKCIGIAFVRFENTDACLAAVSSLHQKNCPFQGSASETNAPKLGVYMVT